MIKKIKAVVIWIGILIIKLIAYPYGLIVYPLAYLLRDVIRNNVTLLSFLWIVLDDEEDYGEEFFLKANNYKRNFITSYKWAAIRNNCWNLNNVLTFRITHEFIVSGFNTSPKLDPLDHCRFKWEIYRQEFDDYLDGWTINQGDRLSQKYTTMGKAFCWYKPVLLDKLILFRSSYAGILFNKIMINYKFGFNDRGEALFDVKFKTFKKEYTSHWR
tara:strand:+ start:370 stop:1014 length:645 start_codon:yes stop_codon:yes gene_type:complete